MPPQIFSATTMLNDPVQNTLREDLGTIKDLMIDRKEGRIVYAVLSFGGILGLGDKLFAVPWSALELDTDKERFVLNVPQKTLKDAPGFNREDWPDMANQEWAREIHYYYQQVPYWEEKTS